VIHIHEPSEPFAALEKPVQQAPATAEVSEQVLAAQQVLVLQHFQPFFISDQAVAPARYGRRLDPRATRNHQEQSLMRQNFQPGSSMTKSWVASGFDVYSR